MEISVIVAFVLLGLILFLLVIVFIFSFMVDCINREKRDIFYSMLNKDGKTLILYYKNLGYKLGDYKKWKRGLLHRSINASIPLLYDDKDGK